jgi:hypothetical protein
MRSAIVPAQITTVEDRVAGNLSISQVALIFAPTLLGMAIFIILPPNMELSPFKLIIVTLIFMVCVVSAVRVKEKIILLWASTLLRYSLRPRYFVYDKHHVAGRGQLFTYREKGEVKAPVKPKPKRVPLTLPTPEIVRLNKIMEDPATNLYFEAALLNNPFISSPVLH